MTEPRASYWCGPPTEEAERLLQGSVENAVLQRAAATEHQERCRQAVVQSNIETLEYYLRHGFCRRPLWAQRTIEALRTQLIQPSTNGRSPRFGRGNPGSSPGG